jgi:predicted transcriptional regulator
MENNQDWADTLSNDLKAELDESILEAEQGKTISHEEALKQIVNRYNL